MNLDEIGFYTLSDERARTASATSRLTRAELLLTSRCNFNCRYCRRVGGPDLSESEAFRAVSYFLGRDVFAVRFSGGEPTLISYLPALVEYARTKASRVAVSSNGTARRAVYDALLQAGVNDFSVSLDACCALNGDQISGVAGSWERVVETIRYLATRTYVTVGIVVNEDNIGTFQDTIRLGIDLGVSDVRVIPAAQFSCVLPPFEAETAMPILRYRLDRLREGASVRGLRAGDSKRCGLVLDDVAVCEGKHYPCIIALREGEPAIGDVGPAMWDERARWFVQTNVKRNPVCRENCLDVCAQYNRTWDTRNCKEDA